MNINNYISPATRFRTLITAILVLFHLTVFGQLKNPEIVFDVGSSLFSSTDQTFFSADNKYMAIADVSNVNPAIKIIDLASGLPIKTIRGENNYWQLQFSSDFKYFRYNRLPTSDVDSDRTMAALTRYPLPA